MTPDFVSELAAHEAYPGHHTEHAWKEQLHVRRGRRLEESALMVGTPSSLISEGIAEPRAEILLGDEEERVIAAHVEGTGVRTTRSSRGASRRRSGRSPTSAGTSRSHSHAGRLGGGGDRVLDEVGAHSRKRAQQTVRFITDPLWRAYITTYSAGYDLCRNWVAGDPARFKRLLTEHLTPADLAR